MIITASTNLNMEESADQDDVGKGTMTCQSALDSEDGSVPCPVELKTSLETRRASHSQGCYV